MSGLTIAVVGATGAVGREFIRLLEDSKIQIRKVRLFASAKSVGKKLLFKNELIPVERLDIGIFSGVDIAFFSAGSQTSKEWASAAIAKNAVVIDNSSAFRLDKDIPLVIPEINIESARKHKGLIANPNCTTIIFALGIYPIYRKYGVKRAVAVSFQAVSGSGAKAISELKNQLAFAAMKRTVDKKVFPHQIAHNLMPSCGEAASRGNTTEENKSHNIIFVLN